MAEAQEDEAHPKEGVDIRARRASYKLRMDYYEKLFRVLVEEGVCPMRAQEINTNPRFMDLLRGYPCKMMILMHHIIRSSKLLETKRDVGHETLDNLDKPSSSATPLDHNDEGDSHASGSTAP